MKTMKLSKLKEMHNIVCVEYIEKFCNKQDIEFSGWVGKDVGEVASFIDQYYFNLSDIMFDINTKQPKGLILQWQSDGIDFHFENSTMPHMNYKSYSMGLKYDDLKEKS